MDGIMDGIGAPDMQISHVSHGSLFPVLALIIFSSVLLYNLVRIMSSPTRGRGLKYASISNRARTTKSRPLRGDVD